MFDLLTKVLNIKFYGWKVREDYDGIPMRFSENQLPSSIASNTDTDLKKKASLKRRRFK